MMKPRRATFDWSMIVIVAIVIAAAVAVYVRDGAAAFFNVISTCSSTCCPRFSPAA
jgi:hypothetical protein